MLRLLYGLQKYKTRKITIAGSSYQAIVADSWIKRAIGLMYRPGLKKGTCMLFLFPYPGWHAIWMRNMQFPIDVLWLDSNKRVIDLRQGVPVCRSFSCPQYAPSKAASYLIELSAGEIKRKKIMVGSKARL